VSDEIKLRYVDGEPITSADIDEAILCMEQRLASGQGNLTSAMCRLSLPMAQMLRRVRDALRAERDQQREMTLDLADDYKTLEAQLATERGRLEKAKRRMSFFANLVLEKEPESTGPILMGHAEYVLGIGEFCGRGFWATEIDELAAGKAEKGER